jgi:hypothetical protein
LRVLGINCKLTQVLQISFPGHFRRSPRGTRRGRNAGIFETTYK